jgi:hypothetical protein
VILQRVVSGHWSTVARTTVGRHGYAFTVTPPKGRPAYRVVVAADRYHLAGISPSRTLHVT